MCICLISGGVGRSTLNLTTTAVPQEIVSTSSGMLLKTSSGFGWSAEGRPRDHQEVARVDYLIRVAEAVAQPVAAAAATAAVVGMAEEAVVSTSTIKSAQATVTTSMTFCVTLKIFSMMSMATIGV